MTISRQDLTHNSVSNSIAEVLGSDSKVLAAVRKESGKDALNGLISLWLVNLCKFFSVGKQMGETQITETAELIGNDYYFLKIDDLAVFGNKFKSGHYGQIFDRIDGNVILIALSKYCEERVSVAEIKNLEKHKDITEEKEMYLIKVGENYVRDNGHDFQEVDKREIATEFSYSVAYRLRGWLAKEYFPTNPKAVIMQRSNKPTESFFDYVAKNNPKLLPASEQYKRATSEYFEMKTKILANETMNEFEKENAIRILAGLEPLTIQEYNEQLTYYKQICE